MFRKILKLFLNFLGITIGILYGKLNYQQLMKLVMDKQFFTLTQKFIQNNIIISKL